MRLILAEKPSVAMDIARTLGTPQKHDGYVTVGQDTITWAYGHLVTLADPDQYDPAWKTWAWATLPMLPNRFQLRPIPKTAAHLSRICQLMQQADRIVMATDGDREGELIGRYIYHAAQVRTPVDRLWLSENTPTAIRQALASMKPASAYDHLAQAAQARAQADWLVGLNATRAFSLRHGQPGHPLSVGRVQTPTLKMIVDRDQAIAQFQPVPYWQVAVEFRAAVGDYRGIWQGPESEHPDRIPTEAQAQALVARLPAGTPGQIDRVETKRVTVKPPLFFNLNDLQKEANRRLGLTAQQTLDAAQSLYDQHLTSYPRTEARVITAEVAKSVPQRLTGLTVGGPHVLQQVRTDLAQRLPRVVNDAAVSKAGHYAIIPTGQGTPPSLSTREGRVFDLITRRLIGSLMPVGIDRRTSVVTELLGELFFSQGVVVVEWGWRQALRALPDAKEDGAPTEDKNELPLGLEVGKVVQRIDGPTLLAKETKPPGHLTDATLLALMEKHGLGTPATRARMIEVLLQRKFIERIKKALQSTHAGKALLEILPDTIQSPDLTGQWEQRPGGRARAPSQHRPLGRVTRHLARWPGPQS